MNLSEAERLFHEALALPSAAERAAFLRGACGDDHPLRRQVEGLLEVHERTVPFLPTEPGDRITIERPSEGPGTVIGRYKLLQQIGEGGMGVVYMAEQTEPIVRKVALKIIKLGMDTRQVIARFEAERQALALMDHPNIAKVFDAGTTGAAKSEVRSPKSEGTPNSELPSQKSEIRSQKSDIPQGRPYFVMELVQGVAINVFCDRTQLPTRERLRLFMQVCQAVQHAHQKGIIHRDLKPSNVLVTLHDGVPVPKVIDFGIAKATHQKLTEKTLFTQFATMVGTPAYMSPEQAEMSGMDVDTRSDIYSLGVLLYELLTGTTPLPEKRLRSLAYGEMQRVIREEEPERPSTRLSTMENAQRTLLARNCGEDFASLRDSLRGDLDWIVMKSLEKDRRRRYETANGLAADVQRYLTDEPVVARPPSAAYRFQKAFRRNRVAFAAAGVVGLVLLVASLIASWQAAASIRARNAALLAEAAQREAVRRAQRARDEAESARTQAQESEGEVQQQLYTARVFAAQALLADSNLGAAKALLESQRPRPGEPDLRGWEWHHLEAAVRGGFRRQVGEHGSSVRSLAVAPDGRWLAAGDASGTLTIWDLTSEPSKALQHIALSGEVTPVSISASGTFLAASCWSAAGNLTVWRLSPGGGMSPVFKGPPMGHAFFPADDRLAMVHHDGVVEIRNIPAGTSTLLRDPTTENRDQPIENLMGQQRLAVSPDGGRVCTVSAGHGTRIWDVTTGSMVARVAPGESGGRGFSDLQFLGDPDELATTSFTVGPEFWSVEDGTLLRSGSVGDRNLMALATSLKHGALLFAGFDHSIRVWDLASRQELRRLVGHLDEVWCVAASPDRRIYSAGQDGQILEWDLDSEPTAATVELAVGSPRPVFSRDGRRVALAQPSGAAVVLDLPSLERTELNVVGVPVAFAEDGRSLHLLELASGPEPMHPDEPAFAVSGRLLDLELEGTRALSAPRGLAIPAAALVGQDVPIPAVALWDRAGSRLLLRDLHSATTIATIPLSTNEALPYVAASPQGTHLAIGRFYMPTDRNEVEVWQLHPPQRVATLTGHKRAVGAGAFSPDGRLLATGSYDGTIRLWRTDTWTLLEPGILRGHKRGMGGIAFSPDGKTLASCNDDGTVKLWNVATQGLLLSKSVGGCPSSVGFTPDGAALVVFNGLGFYDVGRLHFFFANPGEPEEARSALQPRR